MNDYKYTIECTKEILFDICLIFFFYLGVYLIYQYAN